MTRGQLAILAKNLMTVGMFTTAEYALLEAIITTAKADAFDKEGGRSSTSRTGSLAMTSTSRRDASAVFSRASTTSASSHAGQCEFQAVNPIRAGEGDMPTLAALICAS